MTFGDNDKAVFGAGSDLEIYSDGANAIVDHTNTGAGALYLAGDNNVFITNQAKTETKAVFASNGAVTLYYDNAPKLATTNTGVDVTGGLNTTGNVGIGTSSVAAKLDIRGMTGTTTEAFLIGYGANGDNYYTSGSSGSQIFRAANTERMRIDGGDLLVGTTDTTVYDNNADSSVDNGLNLRGDGKLDAARYNGPVLGLNRTGTDGNLAEFRKSGTIVGSISVTASGVTYNTTSDLRLKENIEPLVATDKLMAMNPVSYNWKADPDGPRSMGFIAQEMQEVMPEAVSAGDDEDAMMSMDYGRITPILVSALQDAHRKIEQLEQRIADMEAK